MAIQKVTVSRTDNIYELTPDLVRLPNGKLICIYRESDGHTVRTYSGVAYRSSWDGGHTWSDRQLLVAAYPDENGVVLKWNCPRIQRMQDGRLLASCNVFPCPPVERTDLCNSHIVFWWSEDDGETWSEPQHTPVFGIMPDRVVELPSGAWLLATQVYMKDDAYAPRRDGGMLAQIAHRSEDQGQTWEGPFFIGKDMRYHLCEGTTMLLPDGELVCYMRENSGKNLPGLKAFSRDEGRTWDGIYETPMSGCHRPVAGLLPSGKVLVTYRYRQAGSNGNYHAGRQSAEATWGDQGYVSYWARNTFAYLETLESAKARALSEQGGIILPLDHDHSPRSDGGYTAWVVLHDGTIFCVNYIVDDAPMAQIRGYWFSEDDF